MTDGLDFWRKCSSCKKAISFNTPYYECSVSTCTGLRTGYVFCSVSCWEVHLPGAKHRNAGAIEKRSPTLQQFKAMPDAPQESPTKQNLEPKRILVSSALSSTNHPTSDNQSTSGHQSLKANQKSAMSHEVLVVVSKMKQYIKDLSDMNTAEEVNQTLSHKIRNECEKAIENARQDGRKTVMSRDFK